MKSKRMDFYYQNSWQRHVIQVVCISFVLLGCNALPYSRNRKTTDELKELLVDTNANIFQNDVNAVYEIFPISFADSNGDSIGDIQGIISKLG